MDNIVSALVQIMAWHRTGDKPTPEAMMAYVINAYITRHRGVQLISGISLGMRPANERRRYILTTSLIDWAHI